MHILATKWFHKIALMDSRSRITGLKDFNLSESLYQKACSSPGCEILKPSRWPHIGKKKKPRGVAAP